MHDPGQADDLDLRRTLACAWTVASAVSCARSGVPSVPPGAPQGALARAPQSHARTPVLRLVGGAKRVAVAMYYL